MIAMPLPQLTKNMVPSFFVSNLFHIRGVFVFLVIAPALSPQESVYMVLAAWCLKDIFECAGA